MKSSIETKNSNEKILLLRYAYTNLKLIIHKWNIQNADIPE